VDFTLETLLGGVGLVGGNHLDEAEAARFLGVRVAHDVALLDLAVLLEQTCDLLLAQAGMDAGDKEVGALVAAAVCIARLRGRSAVYLSAAARAHRRKEQHIPAITGVTSAGRGTAGAGIVHVATVGTRRPAAVAVVATGLVYASVSKLCGAKDSERIAAGGNKPS
jgi:hypothetical protein